MLYGANNGIMKNRVEIGVGEKMTEKDFLPISREDMEKLFQNEDNPEVQEKLRKLMEMKSVLE